MAATHEQTVADNTAGAALTSLGISITPGADADKVLVCCVNLRAASDDITSIVYDPGGADEAGENRR